MLQNSAKSITDGLEIFVMIKQVPIPKEMKTTKEGTMDRSGRSMMNPHCANALEEALKLKQQVGGRITVISMGPPNFEQSLKEALSKGADRAYLLSDRKLAGSDTWSTSEALATMIEHILKEDQSTLDVLFAGLQTIDGDTAHVGPEVAGSLGINQVTYVEQIEILDDRYFKVRRVIENGYMILKVPKPVMFSVNKTANSPRGPGLLASLDAYQANITMLSIADIGLPEEKAGAEGSPTVVSRVRNVTIERGKLTRFDTGRIEDRVDKLLTHIQQPKVVKE